MKIRHLLFNTVLLATTFGISSCDDFLDTMPDQRTELDNADKVRDILISAYPAQYPMLMFEFMSDNYDDNGDTYSSPSNLVIESYHWQDAVESDQDSPNGLWNACYSAIAAANQALEAIEELGDTEELQVYKGEALLCRAYGHFLLSNIFCMAYNPQTAESTLGIPYITAPEKTVGVVYERGTMQQVYEMIDADIEKALPLIKNASFDVPLYHFNTKAAYAFAARFNLFYGKDYDKVIAYATEAVGNNPISVLRDLSQYDKFTTMEEWTYGYINKDEPANLLLLPTISRYGRAFNQRYAITQNIMRSQLVWSEFPGGTQLEVYNTVFQSNYVSYIVPKMAELFEITNQIAQIGYPHIVVPAFTTDEALLCRAEAYILKKEYDKAATDLSYWYVKKGITSHTSDEIADFYKNSSPETNAKPLNTGVTYDEKQTNMLHAVLHARRVESIHEGGRWMDIKRYGLSITHNIYGSDPIILTADDPRKAIQLPIDVLAAPGDMTPNPR